jgi:Protein-L-isoaspartate(D-aspartate) O-methyltransferase (PCMT)
MLAEISARAVQLRETTGRGAFDERVMAAMGQIPRHEFVPIEFQPFAYVKIPLPIGFDKTISQPFIVALMTDLLDIGPDDAVLEIGTGLGYQSAILAQLAREVYSIEIIEELGRQAKQRLRRQDCTNVELKIANGYHGWSETPRSVRCRVSSRGRIRCDRLCCTALAAKRKSGWIILGSPDGTHPDIFHVDTGASALAGKLPRWRSGPHFRVTLILIFTR